MEEYKADHYLQKFLEENPDYAEIKATTESITIGQFQDINEDEDEVWLMQCPKGTDVTKLQGEKLKLPGRSNIVDYESVAVEFPKAVSHAFGYCNRKGRYALRLLPVHGSIVLRNRLKATQHATAEEIESICPAPGRVPVPNWIKVRHPLLGVQYEDKITLDKHIVEQLKEADEASTQILRETRSKTRAAKKPPVETVEIKTDDDDVEFVAESVNKKKKKKRKHNESSTDESVPKKSKKSKNKSLDNEEILADLQWIKEL